MIAIIDYDAGNTLSVSKAFGYLGCKTVITRDADVIKKADHVVLPGVGAFGAAMERLVSYELIPVIRQVVENGTPFLGICLGQQLLFEESEESPGVAGLGIIKGKVKLIRSELKVPQIGWNSLEMQLEGSKLFAGIDNGSFVYFVHSYYCHADDRSVVAATCEYGVTVDAAVESGNVFGCQFHPEKSSDAGLRILKNFIS